jgi:hypothetical protein
MRSSMSLAGLRERGSRDFGLAVMGVLLSERLFTFSMRQSGLASNDDSHFPRHIGDGADSANPALGGCPNAKRSSDLP